MKCTDPFVRGGTAYACGRCRLCRVKKRSIWTTRIELEASRYRSNAFATLTYRDEVLPYTASSGSGESVFPTLQPRHLQLFLKRLRKDLPEKLRFFAVGEYGDRSERPHYHLALFNFPRCLRGQTLQSHTGRYLWEQCCPVCRMVGEQWNYGSGSDQTGGDIGLGELDSNRARYLGGYVTKKMTKGDDVRLYGRHPEFSRQSRGGRKKGSVGIGAPVVADLARIFGKYADPAFDDVSGVLTGARGKKRPLGTYLRRKFREAVGTTEEVIDRAAYQAWIEQMLPLHEMAKADLSAPSLRETIIKDSMASSERLKFQEELYKSRKRGRGV